MTASAVIGTWCTIVDQYAVGVEHGVVESLGAYGDEYDHEAIAREYRFEIDKALDALPYRVVLIGDEFVGDYGTGVDYDDIREAIEAIDFWAIVGRHELRRQPTVQTGAQR